MNKQTVCMIATLMLLMAQGYSQNVQDTIEVTHPKKDIFKMNDQKLKPKEIYKMTSSNPESYEIAKLARRNYTAAVLFGGAGGGMVGWAVGYSLTGNEFNWILAGVGAGMIAVSFTFGKAYSRHIHHAVDLYNQGIKNNHSPKAQLRVGYLEHGPGIALKF